MTPLHHYTTRLATYTTMHAQPTQTFATTSNKAASNGGDEWGAKHTTDTILPCFYRKATDLETQQSDNGKLMEMKGLGGVGRGDLLRPNPGNLRTLKTFYQILQHSFQANPPILLEFYKQSINVAF